MSSEMIPGSRQPASKEEGILKLGEGTQVVLGTTLLVSRRKSLQAIAFLPGCQFEIVTADLTTSVRHADLQCQDAPEHSASRPARRLALRRQKD